MLRRLYDWTITLAETPHALWALGVVSFVESSIFPIPPHVLVIPMVIARPADWARIALVASLSSVAGGVLGYGLGAFAFESIGRPVLDFYGYAEKFEIFALKYNEYGAWAVLAAGITPFPFKIITILSGATALSFPIFMISSIIARFSIFFLIAALLWKIGPPIRTFIEKRLGLMAALFVVLLFGGFAAASYLA
ncbi:DedA family protein [Pikeienuella piscinae]|uniref:DedA family protein n=1 Tax=Pikeienuella piscinae TaxID=2748098 RepID=A0A7L5BV02_9RHOB|nr:YqaA family protein [Pikeienuella piscinae]QIE53986.1 DedA family protein [Pikeienuella piscinae]